jgi:acetate kinase
MKPATPHILTINGGSSSIKFAMFEVGDSLRRILEGGLERIGLPEAILRVKGLNQADNFSRPVAAPDHTAAVDLLMDWIEERSGRDALTAVGHRMVHGGPKYSQPQRKRPKAGSSSPTSAMAPAWRRCLVEKASTPAWPSRPQRVW